ncbi:MFS transporter [Hazenella coriacea]|nr:MFS transporter [Hazenella coriacea]
METFVIAIYLSALDILYVTPVLTTVLQQYEISTHWGVWMISIHLAFFSFSLPLMEKYACQQGRYPVFLFSLAIFALGSLTVAFASKWVWIIGGRVIQAIGAGGIVPLVSFYTYRYFSKGTHKYRQFILLVLFAILIVSPLFSSLFTQWTTWRLLFLLYVFVAVLVYFVSRQVRLPALNSGVVYAHGSGILLFSFMILFLMLAVTNTNFLHGWQAFIDPQVMPLWLVSLGLFIPLFMIERQTEYPFFEPHLFANWQFWLLYGQAACIGFSWMGLLFVPGWVRNLLSLPTQSLGGILSFILFVSVCFLPLVKRLSEKINYQMLSSIGLLFASTAYIQLFLEPNLWFIFSSLILLGIGLSFTVAAPVHKLFIQWVHMKQIRNAFMTFGMFIAAGGAIGLVVMAQLYYSFSPFVQPWSWSLGDVLSVVAFRKVLVLAAISGWIGWILSLSLLLKKR